MAKPLGAVDTILFSGDDSLESDLSDSSGVGLLRAFEGTFSLETFSFLYKNGRQISCSKAPNHRTGTNKAVPGRQ